MIGNTWVAFNDKNKGGAAKTFLKYNEKELQALNKKGWGVYGTVNDFEATEAQIKELGHGTTRRQLPFLSKINALYLDFDIAKDGEVLTEDERLKRKADGLEALGNFCMPSKIMETKNGLQPIRLLKDTLLTDDYKVRYTKLLEAMIEWSKTAGSYGDGVKDFTRILRMPHYYHMKGEPFMCEYYRDEKDEYSLDEMEIIFGEYYPKEVKPKLKPKKKIVVSDTKADTYRAVENLDIQEIVISAFKSVNRIASFDNKKRLILDGRLTGTHQGKTGDCQFLASSSHEPFNGNAVTVVADIQNTSNKEAFKRILKEFKIETSKPKKRVIEKKEFIRQGYIYPSKVFDDFDCFMSGELVTIIAESNSGKTTFAMDIIQANADRGKKGFYINLEFDIRTMWESRWLWINKKKKRNLTDIDPLSAADKAYMDNYVDKKLKQFSYYNKPEGIILDELIEYIIEKEKEGYGLIVIDTFSRIKGNLDSKVAHTSQNQTMERLQELAQGLGIAIIMLHHTNKAGVFEGSQKIMDLSNVFIVMNKNEGTDGVGFRTFNLSKDKFVTSTDIDVYFVDHKYMSEEEYTGKAAKKHQDSMAGSF